jgi:hypothetical protein
MAMLLLAACRIVPHVEVDGDILRPLTLKSGSRALPLGDPALAEAVLAARAG